MSDKLPPIEELLTEFDSGKVPRSQTWHTLITGLYFNFDSVNEIEGWYNTVQELTGHNQELANTISDNHQQIEVWYGQIDSWQQQVEANKVSTSQSATMATAQATMARAWAANPEDARVDGERYSSLHYASKSSEYADASSGNAELSRDQSMLAQQAMRNASNSEINANLSKIQAQQAATEAGQSKEASGVSEQKAADSAAAAKNSETAAVGAADSALDSKNSAAGSAGTATQQADRSESEADRSEAAAASLKAISNPNLLINGDFSVNQRGIYGGLANAGHTFFCDRWMFWINTGQQINFNSFQAGQSSTETYYVNLRPVGKIDLTVAQYIEPVYFCNIFNPNNKELTISIDVYSETTTGNINLELLIEYTDGKPRTTLSVEKEVPNSVWTTLSATFDFSDVDLSNVRYVANHIVLSSIATDGNTILLRRPKLELGSTATPFIPDDPATNQAKCQRYYYKHNWNTDVYGVVFDGSGQRFSLFPLPVPMRTLPTFIQGENMSPGVGGSTPMAYSCNSYLMYYCISQEGLGKHWAVDAEL